ncbi:MAG: AAA family ATPase [Deltaproteobacteria bacterium]|nr:AAA family ATPase [Deltaproteobacteria bacterium]
MALTKDQANEIGQEEDDRWIETHRAIVREIGRTCTDFDQDRMVARQLTSELVAVRREEDKVALASDEAVAHGLVKLRKGKKEGLEGLEEQPYFARVVTEEEGKEIEFRLSTESFPAQRIVDWRKAPISKLYYDYKEGDEFSEEIQGRYREGRITLRRSYHGERELLNIIETSQGTLFREKNGWKLGHGEENLSRAGGHDGHLPPILSLITPDQFRLITRDASKPMVIQGIAGSGKTTVALHRLAWLLHEDNGAGIRPENCLVVMFNRSLKAYIETTLPELNIPNVPIKTFNQWAHALTTDLVGPRPTGAFKKSRELELFKSSSVCLDLLLKYVQENPDRKTDNFIQDLFRFFRFLSKQDIFWPRWEMVRKLLSEQAEAQVCEAMDDPLILHLVFAEKGFYPSKQAESLAVCDHLVVDEVQDFGIVEIRALLNAVDPQRTVTLVGDIAQKVVMGRNFDSWDEMLKAAGFTETTPIELSVSHRSTNEIMELASQIRAGGSALPPLQATRNGPSPTFIRAGSPKDLPNFVQQWIEERTKENSRSFSAVICRWPKEAEALVDSLRKLGMTSVRLGHRDSFEFSPGVVVTNVNQVKGLEFRNVLIVDPAETSYSQQSEEERNLLYVAVTRAEQRLDFIGYQQRSKLLNHL